MNGYERATELEIREENLRELMQATAIVRFAGVIFGAIWLFTGMAGYGLLTLVVSYVCPLLVYNKHIKPERQALMARHEVPRGNG